MDGAAEWGAVKGDARFSCGLEVLALAAADSAFLTAAFVCAASASLLAEGKFAIVSLRTKTEKRLCNR